jgi:hypothetical protein
MLVKICLRTQYWFTDRLKGMSVREALVYVLEEVEKLRGEVSDIRARDSRGKR